VTSLWAGTLGNCSFILCRGERFFIKVQTGSGAHRASYTTGTKSSLNGVKATRPKPNHSFQIVPRLSNTGAKPLLHMLSWHVQGRICIYFPFTSALKDTAHAIGAVLDTLNVYARNEFLVMSLEVVKFMLFTKYYKGDEIN